MKEDDNECKCCKADLNFCGDCPECGDEESFKQASGIKASVSRDCFSGFSFSFYDPEPLIFL